MSRAAVLAAGLALLACSGARRAAVPEAAPPAPPAAAPGPSGFVPAAGGGRLAYWVVGTGRDTVVVVHGFQGHGSGYLRADLAPLGGRERTLIVYDQRDDGWSVPASGATGTAGVADTAGLGLEARVEDLEALRRHFGLARLTLLGHSGGAAVAVRYAERRPAHVARLVLIAPPPPARDPYGPAAARAFGARLDSVTRARAAARQASLARAADPRAVCRAVAAAVLPAFLADPASAGRMRGDFCAGDAEALRRQPARLAAFQRSLPADWRASAARVRVPVLVLHGDRDAVPLAAARAWVAALPEARLLVVERADHLPWVEQPARVFAAVAAFVAGRWPGESRARP